MKYFEITVWISALSFWTIIILIFFYWLYLNTKIFDPIFKLIGYIKTVIHWYKMPYDVMKYQYETHKVIDKEWDKTYLTKFKIAIWICKMRLKHKAETK